MNFIHPYDFDSEVVERAEQIAKLPVWARQLVERLNNTLRETRQALQAATEAQEGNTTVVDPSSEFARGIGVNPSVQHEFTDLPGHRVEVSFYPDRIAVYENGRSGGFLTILPRNSNTIEVRPVGRSF